MSEDRRKILEMLANGKITAAEAEGLLDAIGQRLGEQKTQTSAMPKPKYLMIHVDSTGHEGSEHYGKVNVRVPLQVLRAGVKLAAVMPAFAKNKVNEALREQGIDFDIDNIRPQDIEELIDALKDMSIDVNDVSGKVHIYCE